MKVNIDIIASKQVWLVGLWYLTPRSTIFQLYCGCQYDRTSCDTSDHI
jgi:hypothetical protein